MKEKSESEVAQSCLSLSDPWTAAYQAPPSMVFSRQEDWRWGAIAFSVNNLIQFNLWTTNLRTSNLGLEDILLYKCS